MSWMSRFAALGLSGSLMLGMLTGGSSVALASTTVDPADVPILLSPLLPAPILIMGEQHDADAHQRLQAATVQALAQAGQLAALVMEMADRGRSTADLPRDANDATVREQLAWNDAGWPWSRYGPVVMTAVRNGVVVHGGNLPRQDMRAAMADAELDRTLPDATRRALEALIHTAHCELLPASQWAGMARIQIARDRSMAQTVHSQVRDGQTVLLVTGRQHARKDMGVPWHLATSRSGAQAAPVRVVDLMAATAEPLPASDNGGAPDAVWMTPPVPPQDHCADLRTRLGR